MDKQETQLLVLVTTVVVLTLGITLVLFFLYFHKKKTDLLLEKEIAKKNFKEEINRTQIEIKEQALEKISWEIHDNIGQLLSVAKMQLNLLQIEIQEKKTKEKLKVITEIVGNTLLDLRDLAKTLNPNTIKEFGFLEVIKSEVKRLNKLKFIPIKITIVGVPFKLDSEHEIILFRMLQEFLNNSLKHSKATQIKIKIEYFKKSIKIIAEDNGVGFDMVKAKNKKGIGLTNITSRARLINAKATFFSKKDKGTTLTVRCECNKKTNYEKN